jgi:hypothetical protein
VIRMRKHLFAAIVAGGASALAVGLGAMPTAAATATWTVTPGGVFNDPGVPIHSHFTNVTTGTALLCQGLKIVGTFKSGSGLTNPIGQITAATGAGAVPILCGSTTEFNMTFSHYPMGIRAVSYDAGTGVTTGVITGIHITLSTAFGAPACTGTIDGTAPNANTGAIHFSYTNGGGDDLRFNVRSNLHAYNVTGCGGLIHSGDAISYWGITGPYPIASSMPNTITSP